MNPFEAFGSCFVSKESTAPTKCSNPFDVWADCFTEPSNAPPHTSTHPPSTTPPTTPSTLPRSQQGQCASAEDEYTCEVSEYAADSEESVKARGKRLSRAAMRDSLLLPSHIAAVLLVDCCPLKCCRNRDIMTVDSVYDAIDYTFQLPQKEAGEFMFNQLVGFVYRDSSGTINYDYKFDQKKVCRKAFVLAHGYCDRQIYRAQSRIARDYSSLYDSTMGVWRKDEQKGEMWNDVLAYLTSVTDQYGDSMPDNGNKQLPWPSRKDVWREYKAEKKGYKPEKSEEDKRESEKKKHDKIAEDRKRKAEMERRRKKAKQTEEEKREEEEKNEILAEAERLAGRKGQRQKGYHIKRRPYATYYYFCQVWNEEMPHVTCSTPHTR